MLKKPVVAVILCVLIVISSTVISVHTRLDPQCRAVSDIFTSADGIASQLTASCDAANGIIQLADKYQADSTATSGAVTRLREALGYEGPSSLYQRYQSMNTELYSLNVALKQQDLSDRDSQLLDSLNAELKTAQENIADNSYNLAVSSFLHDRLGTVSVEIARICGVNLPEQFA